MTAPIQLVYCYDPMCSWCWGFAPTWDNLQGELAPLVENGELVIKPLLGGLARDSEDPMPADMQKMLQATWQRIESQLGTEFNHNFWTDCQPRRSTYPACRACLVARDHGVEAEMTLAIQKAYYLEATNPSDLDTLNNCARAIGLSVESFSASMRKTKESGRLEQEIREARKMGLNSFPSFAVVSADRIVPINLNYQDAKTMALEIKEAVELLRS
ncbi:MAG: DsbA family protein [Porticoccaceae bacterium]|jgi:putative protein-disulfide isomerase|nr:DsbA family protein [Porticoccaceae bacterium]